MTAETFKTDVTVSFGHCDPAEIVFYPNFFRWFDAAFHSFLESSG
jgi:4-hydroxybenzoyl-CoA thioesterase